MALSLAPLILEPARGARVSAMPVTVPFPLREEDVQPRTHDAINLDDPEGSAAIVGLRRRRLVGDGCR